MRRRQRIILDPISVARRRVRSSLSDDRNHTLRGSVSNAERLLNLQRTHGNAYVQRLIQRQLRLDDCSGWEKDLESFSIVVARHVGKTQINPILTREAVSTNRVGPQDCDVTFPKFQNGITIRVMWTPRTRRTLAKFESGGEIKRFLYEYSCPNGKLQLDFLRAHHTPVPSATP